MRNPETVDPDSADALSEERDRVGARRVWEALRATWRIPAIVTLVFFIAAISGLAILRLALPSTVTFISQFHFTFPGADVGRYPNGTLFSINEVLDPVVLETVYNQLQVGQYGIDREKFDGAFSIRPFVLTETEIADRFRQQLADRRLSFAERERLEQQLKNQLELASRGAAELSFIVQSRLAIPAEVGRAIVQRVPLVWSQLAIEKKGVLRIPGFSAVPTLVALPTFEQQVLPLRIVALTVASQRLQDRLTELLKEPGVLTMRDPVSGESIRDIERDVGDFQLFQINSLRAALVNYQFAAGDDELHRIVDRQIADLDVQIADLTRQADALGQSITQYVQANASLKGRSIEPRSADNAPIGGGTTIPQVSESFIDRIIELTRQDREALQMQAFVADRSQAEYELKRRAAALQAQQQSWKELLVDLRAGDGPRKPIDPAAQAALMKQLDAAAELANAKWAALSRVEAEFAAKRTSRTAEIYATYANPRDVIWSDPILNWTIAMVLAWALIGCFFGVWIVRAGLSLMRSTHYHG